MPTDITAADTTARRFAYSQMPAYPGLEPGLPVIPLLLTHSTLSGVVQSGVVQAIIDSGASVNVLPYDVGVQLGLIWEAQRFPLPVAHWLRGADAFGVLLTGQLDSFPPVDLAFAWTQKTSAEIPIILGETNFFRNSMSVFPVRSRSLRSLPKAR